MVNDETVSTVAVPGRRVAVSAIRNIKLLSGGAGNKRDRATRPSVRGRGLKALGKVVGRGRGR